MDSRIIKFVVSAILAVFPALFWGIYFYKKQPESKTLVVKVFLSGALSVGPLLLYKYLWQYFPWINAFLFTNNFRDDLIGFTNFFVLPLDVVVTFMLVGFIEEITKFAAVAVISKKPIRCIRDSIEFFIIVALGFAFTENIIYFYNILTFQGAHDLWLPFIFRSFFSTFAHIMFSGILGYYYGIAYLAEPVLKEEKQKYKWRIIRKLASVFSPGSPTFFRRQKMLQGIFIASFLHAIFNIFLEMNWSFLIVPFLTLGFIIISGFFYSKNIQKTYMEGEKV